MTLAWRPFWRCFDVLVMSELQILVALALAHFWSTICPEIMYPRQYGELCTVSRGNFTLQVNFTHTFYSCLRPTKNTKFVTMMRSVVYWSYLVGWFWAYGLGVGAIGLGKVNPKGKVTPADGTLCSWIVCFVSLCGIILCLLWCNSWWFFLL